MANLGGIRPPAPDGEPEGPVLVQHGGGGGGRRWDQDYWVWPLPPPGSLAFVCEWPAVGIPESRAETDAGQVLEAAQRSVVLWPESDGQTGSGSVSTMGSFQIRFEG